jgi:hypothetical protein
MICMILIIISGLKNQRERISDRGGEDHKTGEQENAESVF